MKTHPLNPRPVQSRDASRLRKNLRRVLLLLALGRLLPASAPAQEIPWGWQWAGETAAFQPFAADFDGDGKADRCIVNRPTGQWYVIQSSGTDPQGLGWGWSWAGEADVHQPFAADFDGDGKADRSIVNTQTGQWYVIPSSGTDPQGIGWGWQWPGQSSAFTALAADFDGDGKADRCIVNRQTGQWYVVQSSGTDPQGLGWGWQWAGQGEMHTPLAADFDGDGKADRCIVNRQTGQWYVMHSSGTDPQGIGWGSAWLGQTPSHIPFAADLDGDKRADRVLVDPGAGAWYVRYSLNRPPSVQVGAPITISLGDVARLSGTVTDDGRPNPPGRTSVEWSRLSGPGPVTFQDRFAAQTTAQFSVKGVYNLQLVANDGELGATNLVSVSVIGRDPDPQTPKAPSVSAGPDTTAVIPGPAILKGKLLVGGSGSDKVQFAWTNKSGPGNVSFQPQGSAECKAFFSAEGVYTLTLTATSGGRSGSDDVQVSVKKNVKPAVYAGPDATAYFFPAPMSPPKLKLKGSATDSTLPFGSLSVKWIAVSGPVDPIFANPNSPTSVVTFPMKGTYLLKLTANDGQLDMEDEVKITVLPLGQPSRAETVSRIATRAESWGSHGPPNATPALVVSSPPGPASVRVSPGALELASLPGTPETKSKHPFQSAQPMKTPQKSNGHGPRMSGHGRTILLLLLSAILELLLPASARAQRASSVVEWGIVADDGVAIPTGLTNVVAVAAGGGVGGGRFRPADGWTVALLQDGTVVSWGKPWLANITVPSGLSGVSAVAAGEHHAVALKSDGTVVAWGLNTDGQTSVPVGLSDVDSVAAGALHTVALKANGSVVAWGSNSAGQTSVPEKAFSGVMGIAAGYSHSVALKSDGTLIAWGGNTYGQATIPAGLSGVAAIAAGAYHTVALTTDGKVVAWGWNGGGQTTIPAGLGRVIAIAASYGNTVALQVDGTVVAWGDNGYGQTNIPTGLGSVTAIAAGANHTVAVRVPGPRGAAATAQVVNGFVVGAILTDGGYGYIDTPAVTVNGGGGTGATAKATVVDGVVTEITMLNPGSGYTSVPTFAIALPPFPPKRATATAQVANGGVTGITVTDPGHGYDTPPTVLLLGGDGTGATAIATVADNEITGITITNPGTGYTSAPKVSIASPAFAPALSIEVSRVRVRLKVLLGHRYLLEASRDLQTWTAVGDAFVAQEEELAQEFEVDTTGRFFRINQVP